MAPGGVIYGLGPVREVLRDAPDSRHVVFRLRGFFGKRVDMDGSAGAGRIDRTGSYRHARVSLPGASYRIERLAGRKRVHDLFDDEGRHVARLDNSGRMRQARLVLADGRWFPARRTSSWRYVYEVLDANGRPFVYAKGGSSRVEVWTCPDLWDLPHPAGLIALVHEAIDHVRMTEMMMAGVLGAAAGASGA